MNVYERMIEIIETEGWATGELSQDSGCCLLGAKAWAERGHRVDNDDEQAYESDEVTDTLSRIIRQKFPYRSIYRRNTAQDCYRFNDSAATSKEDVLEVLRQAASEA